MEQHNIQDFNQYNCSKQTLKVYGQTVLIVDDSEIILMMLGRIIGEKYNVITASSGEETLKIIKDGLTPDIILLDVVLPGMNGYDVCRILKNDPGTCSIPIIFITGSDSEEDEARGFLAGGADYIPKPFRPSIVMARIKTQLEIRSLHSQLHLANQELILEKSKLESRNLLMEQDIQLAHRIHNNLIPLETPGDNFSTFFKPMESLGGDFFDFITFSDSNNTGIFLSDVSGHGISAAFITSMIKMVLLQAGDHLKDPAALLNYMNEILDGQTSGNFITMFYGILVPGENRFIYSNAGHNNPVLIQEGQFSELGESKSFPVSVLSSDQLKTTGKSYRNFNMALPRNGKLLFFTDGLVEASNAQTNETFEENEFPIFLKESYHLKANQFHNNLFESLVKFHGSDSFEDDICFICMDIQEN